MTERIELTSGEWADFRERDELKDLPNGELRPLIVTLNQMIYGLTPGESSVQADELLLKLLVTAWSFERPIPSQAPDSLSLISGRDYGELAAAAQPYMAEVTSWGRVAKADPTKSNSPPSTPSSVGSSSTEKQPNGSRPTIGSSTDAPPGSVGAGATT